MKIISIKGLIFSRFLLMIIGAGIIAVLPLDLGLRLYLIILSLGVMTRDLNVSIAFLLTFLAFFLFFGWRGDNLLYEEFGNAIFFFFLGTLVSQLIKILSTKFRKMKKYALKISAPQQKVDSKHHIDLHK